MSSTPFPKARRCSFAGGGCRTGLRISTGQSGSRLNGGPTAPARGSATTTVLKMIPAAGFGFTATASTARFTICRPSGSCTVFLGNPPGAFAATGASVARGASPPGPKALPPEVFSTRRSKGFLTNLLHSDSAVQAEAPMIAPGEGVPWTRKVAERWTPFRRLGLLLVPNTSGGPPLAAGAAPPCDPAEGDAPDA